MRAVFVSLAISILLFAGVAHAKEQAAIGTSFDVAVSDKTNNRVLHKERFTFSPIRDGGATVKLIYQIGEFLGGLQFTLMLYSNGTYEAFISPVPDGKVVSSGAVSSKNATVQIDWSGTAYGFSVTAL